MKTFDQQLTENILVGMINAGNMDAKDLPKILKHYEAKEDYESCKAVKDVAANYYTTCEGLNEDSQLRKGTVQAPAKSGCYLVTFVSGEVREEWYTVAFGWCAGDISDKIKDSTFLRVSDRKN
jgi:hypothetical protein